MAGLIARVWAAIRAPAKGPSQEEEKPRPFVPDREFARLMWAGLVLTLITIIGVGLAGSGNMVARSFGIVIVVLMAGGISGAVLGFLFGIPRVLTDANVPPATSSAVPGAQPGNGVTGATSSENRRLLASNSNLEQVSDWLTKIILGVGLTQFYQLNGALFDFEVLVRHFVGRNSVTPLVATLALIFAIVAGFLGMYLETRLVLSRIFNSVERDLSDQLAKAESRIVAVTNEAQTQRDQKNDAQARAAQLETAVQVIADAPATSAQALAPAADALASLATSDQASAGLKTVAAQALAVTGRADEAATLIPTGSDASIKDRIAAMLVALYKDPPGGFQEVLAIAGQLSTTDARNNADYWFYTASAAGQQHHYLLAQPADDQRASDLAGARANALDCIKRCLATDASYAPRIYSLMHPEVSLTPQDNDLVDFAADEDFMRVVPGPSGPIAPATSVAGAPAAPAGDGPA